MPSINQEKRSGGGWEKEKGFLTGRKEKRNAYLSSVETKPELLTSRLCGVERYQKNPALCTTNLV